MALAPPFNTSLHRRLHFPSPHLRVFRNPRFLRVSRNASIRPLKSLRFDRVLTADSESEMTDGFFEAIEELERMIRDPSDVLNEMIERLSSRELQLVLVYFSQEGRDSYCALEVFEWLKKENRVDGETMELMVSIACGWIERLVGSDEHGVDEVVGLLNEMDCVGVEPEFSMVEKVVSLYWERGRKDEAVVFVKDVMMRGGVGGYVIGDEGENGRGGPVGYLAWKMMVSGCVSFFTFRVVIESLELRALI